MVCEALSQFLTIPELSLPGFPLPPQLDWGDVPVCSELF